MYLSPGPELRLRPWVGKFKSLGLYSYAYFIIWTISGNGLCQAMVACYGNLSFPGGRKRRIMVQG
jgi:hypothetical protein